MMGKRTTTVQAGRAAAVLAWLRAGGWRWTLPVPAFAMVATGLLTTGTVNGAKVAAALADPLAVLAARSPGARTPGALTQTKPIKAADMQRRVLSNLRERPGAPGAPAGGAGPAPGAAGPVDAIDLLPADAGAIPAATAADAPVVADVGGGPAPFSGGGVVVPGVFVTPGVGPTQGGSTGGGGSPGGGETGGGTTTTPTTPTVPGTPVAAVPEPAAWLTLLFGFGVIGGALRERRRAASRLVRQD